MNGELSEGLKKELLDDFYAECDDLLSSIRRNLETMVAQEGDGTSHTVPLEELFRAMHSLKGISAIAGVRPAEELAHGVESLLRGVTKGETAITAVLLDRLSAAAELLNRIIGAHRKGRKLPEIAAMLSKLRAQLRASPATSPGAAPEPALASVEPAVPDPVAVARARGCRIWRVIFSPSPEREQRGVKVDSIRQRLREAGEILSATPVVHGQGLRFIFIFAALEAPADLATWQADGIEFEAVEPPVETNEVTPTEPQETIGPDLDSAFGLTPSHIVRVDLGQLDDLMRITGEIIIHRSRLQDRLELQERASDELKEIDLALARSLRQLRTAVSRVRLVPVGEIFSRMPYVVRDLLRDSDKQARVVLQGELTEIDKYLVERLKEPLLHLVRNAFAHAIEPAAERTAAGKPAEATIRLAAARVGDSVEIQIGDDGRGIDANHVAARAKVLGLIIPTTMDANGILSVLCQPGFSTRDAADRAAGRGVGMAVVSAAVRELGGSLRLRTELGRGTEFTLRLPLTLSIADALIIEVGNQVCALPQGQVDELFQVAADEVRTIQRTEVVPYRGGLLPVVRLNALFGVDRSVVGPSTVVVVGSDRGATGLIVDRVRSRREVVIRTFTDPLVRAPGIGGATELGDGRPILVLDPAAITAGVVRPPTEPIERSVEEPVS